MLTLTPASSLCSHHATVPRYNRIMSTIQDAQLNGLIQTPAKSEIPLTLPYTPPSSYSSSNEPLSDTSDLDSKDLHILQHSGIEHCMPRAYIRVCLAFPVLQPDLLPVALEKLKAFVRRIVDAKPYLAGYVVPASSGDGLVGRVETRFTTPEFLEFVGVKERRYTKEEMPFTYAELDRKRLPPSAIRPDLVSALREGADEDRNPAFRVQANIVEGGLIVSFYLHHCISDGTGLSLIISGSVCKDEFAFQRHLHVNGHPAPKLRDRLNEFANFKRSVRGPASHGNPNQIHTRKLEYKLASDQTSVSNRKTVAGRGCIFSFPFEKLVKLKASLNELLDPSQRAFLEESKPTPESQSGLSKNDALQAFLWHHMSLARIPSLNPIDTVEHSKLLIPVNIRDKLNPPLPQHYFGSAVDFAAAQLPLTHVSRTDESSLCTSAFEIRKAIWNIDDAYIRSAIALATSKDKNIDVRDLAASNMNRATGADMYITNWERFQLYEADLDMGLGPPDWVRKPWSKDPGSCIVLPRDARKDYVEVLVQMAKVDMGRLLKDEEFMSFVTGFIE